MHHRLSKFAKRFINEECVLDLVGPSPFKSHVRDISDDEERFFGGICKMWNPRWRGIGLPIYGATQSGDEFQAVFEGTIYDYVGYVSDVYTPNEAGRLDLVPDLPCTRFEWASITKNLGPAEPTYSIYAKSAAQMDNLFRGGDWFGGYNMEFTQIAKSHASGPSSMGLRTVKEGVNQSAVAENHSGAEAIFITTNEEIGLMPVGWSGDTGGFQAGGATDETGEGCCIFGTLFKTDRNGPCFTLLGINQVSGTGVKQYSNNEVANWSHATHLAKYIELLGVNTVMFCIGGHECITAGEHLSKATFKGYLETMITLWKNAFTTAGISEPLIVLLPYSEIDNADYDSALQFEYADACGEVAVADPDDMVCVYDLTNTMKARHGAASVWSGIYYDNIAPVGVHTNVAGAELMMNYMWNDMLGAVGDATHILPPGIGLHLGF